MMSANSTAGYLDLFDSQGGGKLVINDSKRAYKACLHCRKTKSKCERAASSNACVKCVRELRDCQYPTHRAVRQKKGDQGKTTNGNVRRISLVPEASNARQANNTISSSGGLLGNGEMNPHVSSSSHYNVPNIQISNGESFEESEDLGYRQTANGNSHDELMQLLGSSPTAARQLLFRAAEQHDSDETEDQGADATNLEMHSPMSMPTDSMSTILLPVTRLSTIQKHESDLWKQHRFVRQGWFTAQEAVTYLDLFFRNLAPLSPIIDLSYANHETHKRLVLYEPLLCCVLLALSARYHILPGYGSSYRAEYIHMRLWKYCEHLISRITFGTEKYCTAKTRSLGSIQALLLVTEWHPRSLRFPPENDGWDSSLAPGVDDQFGHPHGHDGPNSMRWRQEVFEPSKRSDRFSWSMIGLATMLAHELGVFEIAEQDANLVQATETQESRLRVRRLLFLYSSQLSLRLGCSNIFPGSVPNVFYAPAAHLPDKLDKIRDSELVLSQYISITKILITASDILFPSRSHTRQLVTSGKHTALVDHLRDMLDSWLRDFNAANLSRTSETGKQLVLVEFHYTRLYAHSIAMQSIYERATESVKHGMPVQIGVTQHASTRDLVFISTVQEACSEVLIIAVQLGNNGQLRYCPVRLFGRIASAAVFLLRSLSIDANNDQLGRCLDLMSKCSQLMIENQHDDVHLAARYGLLISRLTRHFKKNLRMQGNGGQPGSLEPDMAAMQPAESSNRLQGVQLTSMNETNSRATQETGVDTNGGVDTNAGSRAWLTYLFDPALPQIGLDWDMENTEFGPSIDSTEFLWSLPL